MPRSIISFFALTLCITWVFWIPLMLVTLGWVSISLPDWFFLLGGLGPIGAAMIMSRVDRSFGGLVALFKPITFWRVHPVWYLLVLTLPLFLHYLILLLTIGLSQIQPDQLTINFTFQYLPALLFGSVFILVEEVGWRGYALPVLQHRYAALWAGLLIGLVWGIWHIPLLFARPEQFGLALDNPAWLAIVVYTLNTMAVSLVFTWIYNNTRGSLLIAALFHGSLNAAGTTYVVDGMPHSLYYWVPLTLFLALLGALVTLFTNKETLSKGRKVLGLA